MNFKLKNKIITYFAGIYLVWLCTAFWMIKKLEQEGSPGFGVRFRGLTVNALTKRIQDAICDSRTTPAMAVIIKPKQTS